MKKIIQKELLAYCGIYCADCLGNSGVIANAADEFKKVLDDYKFVKTVKAFGFKELEEYDKFYKMLGFMTGLKCPFICRTMEDSKTDCKIRKCCINKGFYACYECEDLEDCSKLQSSMGELHTESCRKNLKAIKEMGLDNWLKSGKRVMYWGEIN